MTLYVTVSGWRNLLQNLVDINRARGTLLLRVGALCECVRGEKGRYTIVFASVLLSENDLWSLKGPFLFQQTRHQKRS